MVAYRLQLMKRLKLFIYLKVIRFYQLFEKVPESRKLAGIFFETLGQRFLQENISLEMVPMV